MITKINFNDHTIRSYLMRYYTPKEYFRLMGVPDSIISIMQSSNAQAAKILSDWKGRGKPERMAISKTQQFKLAGNSIVTNVLLHIYNNLFYPKQGVAFDDKQEVQPSFATTSGDERIFLTTFSGYDSQLMAADLLKEWHPEFKYTCAGWSEIDKYACQMHNLIFPQFADKALGDITKIDWHKVKDGLQGRDIDLFTYSSPCQDISIAGLQKGLKKDSSTRSSLLWNVVDAVEVLKPKYLLMENVTALVSKKFLPDFKEWLNTLSKLGYVSKWKCLNAINHGIPQNRDRVFCISMRKDVAFDYQFPMPFELTTFFKDVLDGEADPSAFFKDTRVNELLQDDVNNNCLFMIFPLPPTHEAAMFLKTLLQVWMEKQEDRWSKGIEWNQKELDFQRSTVLQLYKEFQKDHHYMDCHVWYGFEELFKENMERKPTTKPLFFHRKKQNKV